MTSAQTVHELIRDLGIAPHGQDVPWSATDTAWRNPIEKAVEDLPDPECWAALEKEKEDLADKVSELEDKVSKLESDNESLSREVSALEKQVTELLKSKKASAAE